MTASLHEDLKREDDVKIGSERSFGLVFAAVGAVLGGLGFWKGWPSTWFWIAFGAVFLVVALVAPAMLRPLNRLWFRFGLLLNAIISPLVMGLLFYTTIFPLGLVMRLAGKDLLRLKRDTTAESYWIRREPPGPAPETMKNQF